jgi:acetyl-CoA synthetase
MTNAGDVGRAIPRQIHKQVVAGGVVPNLVGYETTCATFTWDDAAGWLDGLPDGGGLNIAHEAVDRHASGPLASKVALRFVTPDGTTTDLTYEALRAATNRFANVLDELGVEPGERVFSLSGRQPELYLAVLGALKHRAVFCPLFSSFGPEPVHQRLARGDAKVLVTTTALYRKRVAGLRDRLPGLEHVLLIDADAADDEAEGPGVRALAPLLAAASDHYAIAPTDPESPALLHFTSGTTGNPKGAVHVHQAVVAHHATGRFALDLHPDDVYWCTADPGWVTGTSYGIISPLTHGVTTIVDVGEFDPHRWYRTLQDQQVTVWYTAPTAIRMLMKAGDDVPGEYDLSSVRFVASVGEPLNPEAVAWGDEVLGLPIHDNWWQTETGGIMVANYASMDIRPGSMGRPIPGIEVAVIEVDDEREPVVAPDGVRLVTEPGAEGMLAIRAGWPSMFRGYLHDAERYASCFADGWYLSGDLVSRDADGWLWFVGRGDDVIKTAGHLVGPFELESVFMEHPAVVEAAVIGLPDPVAGNVLKAFVTLAPGVEESEQLRRELLGFGRTRLGAIAPRTIAFHGDLPKTRSGKIMRRLLRARELGLPEGDLSTLESGPHDAGKD